MLSPDREVHELLLDGKDIWDRLLFIHLAERYSFSQKIARVNCFTVFQWYNFVYGFACLTRQLHQNVIPGIAGTMTSLLLEGLVTVEPCLS